MDHEKKLVIIAFFCLLGLLIFGTFLFKTIEQWSLIDAFYFTGVTMTTVGYGDVTPHTPAGKIATVIFAFTSVSIAFYALNLLARRAFRQRLENFEWILQKIEKDKKVDIIVKHK